MIFERPLPLPSPDQVKEGRTNHGKSELSGLASDLSRSFGNWSIRQDILYLDNGAFGACPVNIVQEQRDIREKIEENPHDFYERNYVPAWEASRKALAKFLSVDPVDLILVPGATHGLNIVIQSLCFDPDDEILTTNHAYSSVILALEYVARRDNARLVIADIPLHVNGPEDVLHRILSCVTPRTRFAVIDHIPSRSGLIFPIKRIVSQLDSFKIDTLVDGAHAAGMIPLNITDIGAAYYVANCHKWMCSPRGVGFVHVRPDRASNIKPLVVARSPYVLNKSRYSKLEHSFGWMGTSCPSGVLSLPACLDFLNNVIPGGYSRLIARNHDLAVFARRVVCRALGIPLPCPDSMIGAMATIPLPDSPGPDQEGMIPIQQTLWKEHGIVIPVYSWPSYPKRVVRLSVQAYNNLDQYFHLADCLRSVLDDERKLFCINFAKLPSQSLQGVDVLGRDHKYVSIGCVSSLSHQNGSVKGADHLLTPHKDIKDPEPWMLRWLAKIRISRLMTGKFASYPVALYPTAGDALTQFTSASKRSFQHANLEMTRMMYMLACVDRRRIPQQMATAVTQLLETKDVIESFAGAAPALRTQGQTLTEAIIYKMQAQQTPNALTCDAKDFVDRVVPYETERQERNLSLTFWLRAVNDFNNGNQCCRSRVVSFLQIHSFLKDPLAGLFREFKAQAEEFASLLDSLQPELGNLQISSSMSQNIVAQLAIESSFISQSLARHPSYIFFSEDQQLVYSHVDIHHLARAEFASPLIVSRMIRDIMSIADNECAIAPIAVTRGYALCSSSDTRPIIIDGNNRVTTITFLIFVATFGVPDAGDTETLRAFCRDQDLGPIFFVDLEAVLQNLWTDALDVIDLLKTSKRLEYFKTVRQVPVLVTEESTFFTKEILRDGTEDVLQPIHQYIFASDEKLVALPSKMQSHGRAKGFKALPLR